MKLPALLSRFFRAKSAVSPLAVGAGWPVALIHEPYAGAWQSHVVVDSAREVVAFSPVYACVTRIARDIAKLRPMLVRDNPDGTCTEVEGASPFKAVLERPNHYQNRIQFIEQWIVSKLLRGNTYALKERDGRGLVTRLHIVDRATPMVTISGDVYYDLGAVDLAGIPQGRQAVPAREMAHDRMCPLWHPLVGVSPLYAAAVSATMGNRIQANSTNFFGNMSSPGGYLESPKTLTAQEINEMRERWQANYTGANAGRVAVLAGGLKFNPSKPMPAHEAQLIDQLRWTVEDVARCFSMPAYKVGGELPANTTVEALNQAYYSECLQALIEDFELVLTEALALPAGMYVELDLDGLLRMDRSALIKAEAEGVQRGIFSPNESRRRLNLPPAPGGEHPYMQQQQFSLEALSKRDAGEDPFGLAAAAPPPAPAKPATEPANDDEMDVEEARAALVEIAKGVMTCA